MNISRRIGWAEWCRAWPIAARPTVVIRIAVSDSATTPGSVGGTFDVYRDGLPKVLDRLGDAVQLPLLRDQHSHVHVTIEAATCAAREPWQPNRKTGVIRHGD